MKIDEEQGSQYINKIMIKIQSSTMLSWRNAKIYTQNTKHGKNTLKQRGGSGVTNPYVRDICRPKRQPMPNFSLECLHRLRV